MVISVNAGNLPQGPMMNQMNVRPQMMQMDQQQQHQMMAVNQQQQMNQPMNQMGGMNQQQHMAPMNAQQQMNPMQQQQLQQQQQQHQHQLQQQQQQFQQNSNQQQNQANTNMNMGNTLMQQLNAPSQQQAANNPSSALLSQLNQTQQQTMGPMNPGGMQRPRFPVQAAAAVNKMNPQQQQTAQQQQLINQQMLQQQQQQQRKQQSEMINQQQQQQGQQPQFVTGPGVPSPAQQQTMPMQSMAPMSSTMTVHNMGAPSPAYVHSPGNVQLVSSPASGVRMTAPQHQQMQQAGRPMAGLPPPPSPSMMNIQVPTPGMLHTPQGAGMGGAGMVGHGGGPVPGTEDHLYLDKVRQLSRFIEPLTKLISRFGEDDSEKLGKMKIMLDILSNPNKRMPMDTLLKCEAVLEKMDFKKVFKH